MKLVIIGSGFGGIGMAIQAKRAGFDDLLVLTRDPGVGGVWWDNTYPGAACDIPSSLYSFAFEGNYDWHRSHGTHAEIRSYLEHCVRKYRLEPHLRFRTEVSALTFDDAAGRWHVRTAAGEEFEADAVVSACGLFNRPIVPDLPGAASFRGEAFHSARWEHGFDPSGKRVAVIGTGCSAAQIVPAIAARTAHLTLFQRTPAYVFPANSAAYGWKDRLLYRLFPRRRRRERETLWTNTEKRWPTFTDEELRKQTEANFGAYLESQVSDPEKRRKLTPTYAYGCKRKVNSDTFLKALDRPDVDVVTASIARIDEGGIHTADGAYHPADAIVYATGFAPARYLSTMRVTGTGGLTLDDAWQDGPQAYLGMTVAGFPNFFMVYGPNTNAPTSIVFMIECQVDYIVACLRGMLERGVRRLEPRADIQAEFNDQLQEAMSRTAWASGCRSYGMTAAGKVVTQWPNASGVYRERTAGVDWRDYVLS